MASLYKPTVATYQLADGKHRTPDGKRVTKDTPGARKVSRKSEKWYGSYKSADGSFARVPLCSNKQAAKDMLAKLVTDAGLEKHGMGNPFGGHHSRPLRDHLEDYRAALLADGDTAKHVKDTVARVKRILAGCNFVFIRDLSASAVQAFLADLRNKRRPRAELPPGKQEFTKTELVEVLGVHPRDVYALLRRHEIEATGKGKNRMYPRGIVVYLQDRLSRGAGTTTVNAYLRSAKGFTHWLVRDRRTGLNPLAYLSTGNPKLDRRHQRRALPVDQLRLLLEAAKASVKEFRGLTGPDRAMLYATAMGTGFRAAELASLRPASFDLNANSPTATVEAAYAKNRQEAVQPLPLDLAEGLRGYLADKPKGQAVWPGTWPDDAAKMLRIDLRAAGIPYRDSEGFVIDFHGLRHSFITLMAQSGIHPKLAQSLARHSSITMTMDRYAHVRLYDQAEGIKSLPSLLAPGSRKEALGATGTDGKMVVSAKSAKGSSSSKRRSRLECALSKEVIADASLMIAPGQNGTDQGEDDHLPKSFKMRGFDDGCESVIGDDKAVSVAT